MTDQPKRRGRPRKVPVFDPWAELSNIRNDSPTPRLRVKDGAIQQAWQHPNGIQWRTLPVVSADAPDWEEG